MRYLYYPGCSLEGTASEYDLSTRRVMQAADVELIEREDWTCCGASAAEATSELLSFWQQSNCACRATSPSGICLMSLPMTSERKKFRVWSSTPYPISKSPHITAANVCDPIAYLMIRKSPDPWNP